MNDIVRRNDGGMKGGKIVENETEAEIVTVTVTVTVTVNGKDRGTAASEDTDPESDGMMVIDNKIRGPRNMSIMTESDLGMREGATMRANPEGSGVGDMIRVVINEICGLERDDHERRQSRHEPQ